MADTSKETKAPQQSPKDKPKQDKPAFVREKGRGIVKSVLSGDTIVVLHMAQQGPPVERQITLSSLQAPMLGRRKTKTQPATQDEPFAWSAREFLRKKVIGKNISYTIEFKTPTGREYGVVTLANNNTGEQESIAPSVVENGWAKVKRPANPPKDGLRPELQQLVDLEEQAKKSEKGIWNTNPDDLEHSKRPLDAESNCAVIYEQFKGKAITGIVESVRSGSSFRVTLLPSFAEVMLYLSGAQAPEPVGEGEFEPFGRESRFFTEHHILNREVQILLEGVDKFNCYGTVSYLGRNVAEELLKNGLGRYVDWSGSRTKAVDALKAAEKDAKEKSIRIWSVPATKVVGQDGKVQTSSPASSKPGKEIYGKVVEVINGSTIVVQDQGGHEHKINLSSIEVPRLLPPKKEDSKKEQMVAVDNKKDNKNKEKKLTKEAVERAYAMEAKELLRKRVIGQKVKCLYDYTLASTPAQAQAPPQQNKQGPLPDRVYYSVYIDKNNVGVELTEAGFASARVHKGGEQRSRDYETILLAEDRAKKLNKGIHGSPDKAPVLHINDISQLEPAKAKQFLPHLKRHGKQRGVIEFEFSGSRVKLYVPKESASIIFSLAAVSAPRKTEPFGAEGYAFTRDVAHQRDVEFEILSQDKNGTFVGNLWVNKKNLATLLLEQGFAETYSSVRESEHQAEYLIAEESAKRAKKGLWKDYDEVAEAQKRKKAHEDNEERRKPKQEFIEILVTEIIDGSKFYVQIVGKDTEQLDKLMKDLSTETSETPYNPKVDELVKAQFEDDAWYRAKVKAKVAEGEYEIFYIDFGNSEVISNARLRPLEHSFTTLPPQAVEAQLAYIRAPSLDEDYGPDAAVKLRDLVYGKQMLANIEYRDSDRIYLSLGDRESQIYVNAAMLREGLARVEKVRGRSANQLVEKLREEEDKARASHAFIWEYGDPGFDDEEEKLPAKKPVPVTKKDAKEAANKK